MTETDGRVLPPMTVARFEEATKLIEQLVAEKTDVFLEHANVYKRKHRAASERSLTPQEAAQIAAAMAEVIHDDLSQDPGRAVRRIQESGLRAVDEPAPQELLLAAGLATAPALLDVVKRLVALVEMDADVFEDACEGETLDDAIAAGAKELRRAELGEARQRATAALEHVQKATGASKGEAMGLLVRTIVQAFSQAMEMSQQRQSQTESSTASLVNTDGPGETSSTAPPGEQP